MVSRGTVLSQQGGSDRGTPSPPYLFLIIGEVFSMAIKCAVELGYIKSIKLSTLGPMFSHLLFADYTLNFLMATEDNCRNMSNLLHAYHNFQGNKLACKNWLCILGLILWPSWLSSCATS